mmetsp:Transcript_17133/g.22631  ORF Transcript_17133/g.22631 Transcript_17133/m.22631 type:complete len:421 (+) Transcript_17133:47-1309(+)
MCRGCATSGDEARISSLSGNMEIENNRQISMDNDGGWQRMGFSNSHGGIPFISSSAAQLSFSLSEVFQRNKNIIFILIGTAGCLLVAVALMSPSQPAEEERLPLSAYKKGELRDKLRRTSEETLRIGATSPLSTSFEIIEDGGIEFIWSKANIEATEKKDSKATLANEVEAKPAPSSNSDPFDAKTMDMRLFIADVPPQHSLILNKFNTMADHALLVTKEWKSQSWMLTPEDLTALYDTITNINAIGFYNSGAAAGASQAHKHMQMIPLDVLQSYRPMADQAIPVDDLIFGEAASYDPGEIFMLPSFSFKHGVVMLSEEKMSSWKSEHLFWEYQNLLVHTGLLSEIEEYGAVAENDLENYNLLITEKWMIIVPRSQRKFMGVDVNAMGFIGCLLSRTEAAENNIKSFGPLHILSNVAVHQ